MATQAFLIATAARWVDRAIFSASVVIALGALLAMFVALMLEVVVRYVTHSGLGWPTELPNLLFPWLIMSGVVLASQRGQHIAVTALLPMLGKTALRMLLIGLQLLLFVTFIYLADVGLTVIEVTGSEVYPVTGVHASWAYMALIAGFLGVALTALTTVLHLFAADDPNEVRVHATQVEI